MKLENGTSKLGEAAPSSKRLKVHEWFKEIETTSFVKIKKWSASMLLRRMAKPYNKQTQILELKQKNYEVISKCPAHMCSIQSYGVANVWSVARPRPFERSREWLD